jgi:uncharacterized protein (DUF885 family)
MNKLYKLLFVFCFFSLQTIAQHKGALLNPAIQKALKEINDFQTKEWRADSAANHPLGSNTGETFLSRYNFYSGINTALDNIDKASLSFNDKINLELLKYDIEDNISAYKYKSYLNPILADEGFHTSLAYMGSSVFSSKEDCENYLKRLKDIPRYVDENLALMRKGLILGIDQPKAILDGYQNTYEQHIVSNPTESIFYKPFLKKSFTISDEDWKKITDEAKADVEQYAVQSFKKIKVFFDKEYLPKTRTTIGVSNFPNGLAYYQEMVHHYTTTNMSYEEVYQLGLSEVARIRKEMDAVLKELNFKGSMQDFIKYLRTDPKFYVTSPEQLLKEASYICKKADGMLPSFFGKLPRQPYGVEAVPAYLAPTYTAGRYSGASIHGKRAAHYWVNTYDLKSRPLYNLEALTMHEAVPGHHLQISLAQELDSLPSFRQNLYVNAFGEGWGLYAEYLGTEMGFYKDPYSHFGKLTYEMWRACRLVLDVALHTKGWTRDKAVKYLADNTALSLHEVNTEINRYISWPGQALAYKMGELKIKELRKKAEEQLKDKFDIRAFHDLVLSQGSVTLNVLEEMVNKYIAAKLK